MGHIRSGHNFHNLSIPLLATAIRGIRYIANVFVTGKWDLSSQHPWFPTMDAEMSRRPRPLFCLAAADFAFSDGAVTKFKDVTDKRRDTVPQCKWNTYIGEGFAHGLAVCRGSHTDAARCANVELPTKERI